MFDVPDHWEENYDSNQNTYYYKDRTKDFYLQVYYKKPMNLTMEQYIFYHQQFLSANLLSDNVTSLDFPTTNLEDESVITYKVLSMNEQTIGYVESNGKDQNQNHMISRYYSIKKEDSIFILAFHCKTRKLKHYKAMFEHIVSSIECY